MRRICFFFFSTLLCLFLLTGCGHRIAATIQADAVQTPLPDKLSWAAIPGKNASDPQTMVGVRTVAEQLSPSLSGYGWKWLDASQAGKADVLVRVWWVTEGPQYIVERHLAPRYYGPVVGPYPYTRGPWYTRGPRFRGPARDPFGYGPAWDPDPLEPFGYGHRVIQETDSIQTIFSRMLVVEALRVDALPKGTLEALLPAGTAPAGAAPVQNDQKDLSKGPYAPALSLDGNGIPAAPDKAASSAGPGEIPAGAVLWRVVVRSGGSQGNTFDILPQLSAAAAQAVGRTLQTDAFIDSELGVTFDN